MRRAILFAVLVLFATSAFAQMPPGKWWRRPEIVQTLGLTEEQQDKLDAIFRGAANDLIDAKADIDKANVALRGELDRTQLDRAAIRAIVQKINAARSRRFEREVMMFVDMRAVLTDQQWNRMREVLDRLQAQQEQQPAQRPRANNARPR